MSVIVRQGSCSAWGYNQADAEQRLKLLVDSNERDAKRKAEKAPIIAPAQDEPFDAFEAE